MKRLSAFMFYFGIVLSLAAYFVDKADKLPPVLHILAPSYVRASKGIETLESRGYLVPADEGFSEIESVFWEQARERGLIDKLGNRTVLRFERKTAMIAFGENRAGEVVPVEVVCVGIKITDWDMASIRRGIEPLKETKLLRYSFVIMLLGIIGLLAGRFVERKGPSKPSITWAHRVAVWRSSAGLRKSNR